MSPTEYIVSLSKTETKEFKTLGTNSWVTGLEENKIIGRRGETEDGWVTWFLTHRGSAYAILQERQLQMNNEFYEWQSIMGRIVGMLSHRVNSDLAEKP